jgi:peptidyl-Lys metalloendopeptidase
VPLAVTGSTSYVKCTTTEQSLLTAARTQASTYSADASSYLNAGTLDSRYTTWFGYYNTLRYGTVTSHFNSILNAMNTADITFDCKCRKKYYAYVYANKPYVIHLCRVYWTAPPTGTDSQAGTLIHEMSHFNTVAGTNDWVYGQSGAMSLAITDPQEAVTNADNHEYFAENNPQLP